jgi:hypothetical protein
MGFSVRHYLKINILNNTPLVRILQMTARFYKTQCLWIGRSSMVPPAGIKHFINP